MSALGTLHDLHENIQNIKTNIFINENICNF